MIPFIFPSHLRICWLATCFLYSFFLRPLEAGVTLSIIFLPSFQRQLSFFASFFLIICLLVCFTIVSLSYKCILLACCIGVPQNLGNPCEQDSQASLQANPLHLLLPIILIILHSFTSFSLVEQFALRNCESLFVLHTYIPIHCFCYSSYLEMVSVTLPSRSYAVAIDRNTVA